MFRVGKFAYSIGEGLSRKDFNRKDLALPQKINFQINCKISPPPKKKDEFLQFLTLHLLHHVFLIFSYSTLN